MEEIETQCLIKQMTLNGIKDPADHFLATDCLSINKSNKR